MTLDLPLPPQASAPFDVVGYGENSVDVLAVVTAWPEPDAKAPLGRLEIATGGQTATAVLAAARLGCRTRYVGAFGDDRWAGEVRAALSAGGVDVVSVERAGAATRMAVVLVDDKGRRTVLERRDPRLAVERGDVDAAVFQSGRILLVDATDVPGALQAARAAREKGIPVMVDVDQMVDRVEMLLGSADVLIVPAAFVTAFTGHGSIGAAMATLAALLSPRLVIATLGPEGSLARYRGQEVHTAAKAVEVRDTTGAGDVFRGAFAAKWAAGGGSTLEALLEFANTAAGLACRGLGAQASLPTRGEVEAILAQ
jgi:sugar/nucleoside kinase (ribokinase family)